MEYRFRVVIAIITAFRAQPTWSIPKPIGPAIRDHWRPLAGRKGLLGGGPSQDAQAILGWLIWNGGFESLTEMPQSTQM